MPPYLIALAFLRLMDFLTHRGIIESKLSRNIIHIGTGPIFVLCWLMYPDLSISRWLAALVPFVITYNSVEVFVHYGHNRRIYDNLQVQRRTEAVARELGLL